MWTLVLYTFLSTGIFILFHRVQPTAYMDETVHIPQAQKYFEGNFEWDERLTTPPGMYLVSLSVLIPLSKIVGHSLIQACHFRMFSLMFSVANAYLLIRIIRVLHQKGDEGSRTISAFNISLFPVLYFLCFFYYTESGSTFFVLLAYFYHLKGAETRGAIYGAVSLLFRQTNIVWIFFMGCDKMTDILNTYLLVKRTSEDKASDDLQVLLLKLKALVMMPLRQGKLFLNMASEILSTCAPYIVVGLGFLGFVYWNEGVVVGDRRNHQVTFHLPQFLYALGFLFVFANPFFVTKSNLVNWLNCCSRRPERAGCFMAIMASSLFWLHYDHHYLDDERHVLVVVWRTVFREGLRRYCYIPVYCFSGWVLWNLLVKQDVLWKFFLMLSVALSVIFEGLFELRYFILPYLFCRMHFKVESRVQLFMELVLFSIINVTMFYHYVRPPYEPNWYKSQRLFW